MQMSARVRARVRVRVGLAYWYNAVVDDRRGKRAIAKLKDEEVLVTVTGVLTWIGGLGRGESNVGHVRGEGGEKGSESEGNSGEGSEGE